MLPAGKGLFTLSYNWYTIPEQHFTADMGTKQGT